MAPPTAKSTIRRVVANGVLSPLREPGVPGSRFLDFPEETSHVCGS